MAKKLRRKFVFVTVLMMVTLFAVLWTINYLYTRYWMEQDYLSVMELVSYSGVFTDDDSIDKESIFEELTDGTPIIGIVLDSSGNVLEKKVVGRKGFESVITDDVVNRMFRAENGKYKTDRYIFTRKGLDEGKTLIVAISTDDPDDDILKVVSNLLWAGIGLLLLVLVAFFLSRYVTAPAMEALEKEKRFISDASHELKTPLGAININAQALELNGEKSIYVKNIISESERMNRLVERLLTLSRLEDGYTREQKEFSLSDVINEMILTYESIAFEKRRKLTYEVEDGISLVGDDDEIRQLITILIDNALKNSFENTEISVKCVRADNGILVDVKNIGRGIEDSDIDFIFDRFYTTEHSRSSSSFGLGLAIAKAIVERHKGSISVISVPTDKPGEKETVFSILF